MALNEMISGASEIPRMTPVSYTGKKPLGATVERDRQHQRGHRHHQRGRLMPQDQRSVVAYQPITASKPRSVIR